MDAPYPLDCWWVAAPAEAVTQAPMCQWLLHHRIVLFRTEGGMVAALRDRCAHRWAALSQGQVQGEEIVCPYHGLRFDTGGACTHAPARPRSPPKACVPAYPVVEHGSFVWIWLGDSTKADPSLLPDIPWFTDPAFLQVRGYTELGCNSLLLQENVLDLTHIAYVHGGALSGWEASVQQVGADEKRVSYSLTHEQVPIPPSLARDMGTDPGTGLRRYDWGSFAPPGCTYGGMDYGEAPVDGEHGGHEFRAMHCTTPISSNRSHYWWAAAQNYGLDARGEGERLTAALNAAFEQDRVVLEAIQATIDHDVEGARATEAMLASDHAAISARRIVRRMMEQEKSGR